MSKKRDVIDFVNSVSKVKNDLSEPLNIYRSLEKKYISASNKELLDSLHKEKDVIFSYLKNFENAPLKEVRAYLNEVKENMDLDEVKNYSSPKSINFVKVAYKKGNWTIKSDKMAEAVETDDVPSALNYLTRIVARFDPQEAAYTLEHAKNNGTFIVAALPDLPSEKEYENATQDATSQFINTYTTKGRGYTKLNEPVSLQADIDMAEQEAEIKEEAEVDTIREGNVYLDDQENLYTVTLIDKDNVIFSDNKIKPLDEVKELVESGAWKRQAGVEEEKEIKKLERELLRYNKVIDEYNTKIRAAQELINDYRAKVEEAVNNDPNMIALKKKMDEIQPKLQAKMKRMQELEVVTGNLKQTTTSLVKKIGNIIYKFTPTIIKERATALSKLKQIIPAYRERMGRAINVFDEFIKELVSQTVVTENLISDVDVVNPATRENIDKYKKELKKQIKTSAYSNTNKKYAYQILDDMLVANIIDFNTYNEFSDCVEQNSEISYQSLNKIKASLESGRVPHYLTASAWDKIKDTLTGLWNKTVALFNDFFNFVSADEADIEEMANELDMIMSDLDGAYSDEIEFDTESEIDEEI